MYKFLVVTDPDTAPGFRLAGVEVMEASSQEEARKVINTLVFKDDTGIVAVNEEFIAQLAQFNSLEQMINLNKSFEQMLSLQQLTQASGFIGVSGPSSLNIITSSRCFSLQRGPSDSQTSDEAPGCLLSTSASGRGPCAYPSFDSRSGPSA
jgi:hypothetical protein